MENSVLTNDYYSFDLQQLVENDTEKLQTRKWVISGVLDSEKGYVECLELFKKVPDSL